MIKYSLLFLFVCLLFSTGFGQLKTEVLCTQNAENSSEVWEILSLGVHQFEADVMPIYGELYVTPTMPDSANHVKPTLRDAYLLPLFNQFKKNNGNIIPRHTDISYLILDIGYEPHTVIRLLRQQLRTMQDMLVFKADGKWHPGKLQILIKAPIAELSNQEQLILTGVAGSGSNLSSDLPVEVMPLIELPFSDLTTWNGIGNIAFEEYLSVKKKVAEIHQLGRKVYVSKCPTSDGVWDMLQKAEVDFIGTNHVEELVQYLTKNTKE
jgi:hypothetical protein